MEILEVLLAFAVTMLGFATLVTFVMEFFARLLTRRGRVFSHMLGIVFQKEIWPHVQAAGKDAAQAQKDFVAAIRESPLGAGFGRVPSWLRRMFAVHQSSTLSCDDFVVRLARSEWAGELRAQAEAKLDEILDAVCARYDEVAAASREYFKASSSVISLVVGIGLAFALNVDGTRVFQFYMEHEGIAAEVAAQAQERLDAQTAAQAKLDAALAALDQEPEGDADPEASFQELVEDAKSTLGEGEELVASLAALSVPVGWSEFPYCRPESGSEPSKACQAGLRLASLGFVSWLLATLVTGFLIGLGGPFWYDGVSGVMRVTNLMRGRAAADDTAPGGAAPAGAKPKPAAVVRSLTAAPSPPAPPAAPAPGAPTGGPS